MSEKLNKVLRDIQIGSVFVVHSVCAQNPVGDWFIGIMAKVAQQKFPPREKFREIWRKMPKECGYCHNAFIALE